MQTIESLLLQHPFFKGVHEWYLEQLTHYAEKHTYKTGDLLIQQGMVADKFFLILEGEIEIGMTKAADTFHVVQRLGPGNIVGWSWLIPPHQWRFDAKASKPTTAIVLDGRYLRAKCEEDPVLGYELLKRLTSYVIERLNMLRLKG